MFLYIARLLNKATALVLHKKEGGDGCAGVIKLFLILLTQIIRDNLVVIATFLVGFVEVKFTNLFIITK